MKTIKLLSAYIFLISSILSSFHNVAFSKAIVPADIVEGQDYSPNFLKKNSHFEKSANGVLSYKDAAGAKPVDGLNGAATLTCTRTASAPLDGDGSLLITKTAANLQGEGCGISFTIDSAYKAKVLQIEMDYIVKSGTFAAGTSTTDSDLIVYLYDQTNSTLIEPSSIKFLASSTTIPDKFVANFQTSATGTTYNLILHQALTTSATGYTIALDNLVVKPSSYVYGTPITDWVSYTPTITGFGTPTGISVWSRRVGDSLQLKGSFTSGTATAVQAQMTLGYGGGNANVTTDNTKAAGTLIAGHGNLVTNSTTYFGLDILSVGNANYINFGVQTSTASSATAANGNAVGSTLQIAFYALIPITGWSSSTQVSDSYSSRELSARLTTSSTSIPNTGVYTLLNLSTSSQDTAGMNTTGASAKITVPSSGTYKISGWVQWGGSGPSTGLSGIAIYKNGSQAQEIDIKNGATGAFSTLSGSVQLPLIAGDYIDLRVQQNGSGAISLTNAYLELTKLQAPTTISATEVVAASYYITANTSNLTTATATKITLDQREVDTHGAYSSGTFTAPASGIYRISGSLTWAANGTGDRRVYVYKNGSLYAIPSWAGGIASQQISTPFSISLNLVAGNTIELYGYQTSGGGLAVISDANKYTWLSIERIK